MKKLINIAAVLLAASMIFVGCSNGVAAPGSNNGGSGSGNEAGGSAGGSGSKPTVVNPTVASVESIKIEDNIKNGGNYQGVVEWLVSDNAYVAKTGDVIKFTIKAAPDKDVSEYKAFLVDNTEVAGWWKLLSSYVNTGVQGKASQEDTIEFSVTLTADASSAEPAACKLALYCDAEGNGVTTLTVSSFEAVLQK